MLFPSRREFLGSSLAALAAGPILPDDKPATPAPRVSDDPPFQPTTLFLTWQRDPTTTMTVQWVGVQGETSDTRVYHAATAAGPFQAQPTAVKPYPLSDFKVFR